MMLRKRVGVIAAMLLLSVLVSTKVAMAVPFDISDPNTWATAAITGQTGGPGADTYSQSWELQWSTEAGAAAGLASYRAVGFEWQPDGNGTTADSATGPAGWAFLASGGGFIGAYANGDGDNDANAASYGLGLVYQAPEYGPYTFTFTTTSFLNPMNYHIQFAHPEIVGPPTNPRTRYVWNQNSLEAPPTEVPEPASLVLLGSGLAALGLWRRRGRNAK